MSRSGSEFGVWDQWVDRSLLPEWFSVEADLAKLEQVLDVGAAEAAVLYAARLLDVLAGAAVRLLGLSPGPNVFDNLQLLEQFGLPPRTTRYWAHGLRRIGNEARHLHRRIENDDALLARTLLDRWLEWFFCQFSLGPRLAELPPTPAPREQELPLRRIVLSLDREDAIDTMVRAGSVTVELLATIVVAESLLDRADPGAVDFLVQACDRHPSNPRLRQLRALSLSRTEGPEGAIAELEPLLREAPDDPETQGILAGAYKRLAQRSGEQEWLEKAHRLYSKGWSRSRSTNTYLGINAAATALWLGRYRLARETAQVVSQHLSRATYLDLAADLWAPATLAEAKLILGELAGARQLYERTFQIHSQRMDAVLVARRQADRILESLWMDPSVFWTAPFQNDHPTSRVVGVTGHRSWVADGTLEERVMSQWNRILAEGAGARCALATGLAEGADRLVLQLVRANCQEVACIGVLPMEPAAYMEDFTTAASREEFRTLLSSSDRVLFPDAESSQRPQAYESCGRRIVEMCDVLLALWDGQPSRGPGGTADVVDYARANGRDVRIVGVQR